MFFIYLLSRFIDHFPCVFLFVSLCPRANQFTFTHCYFHVLTRQHNGFSQCFSGCLLQNVSEVGYAISLWSASTRYLALMLTEGAEVDHCTKTYIPTTWESIGYADGNVLNPAK